MRYIDTEWLFEENRRRSIGSSWRRATMQVRDIARPTWLHWVRFAGDSELTYQEVGK